VAQNDFTTEGGTIIQINEAQIKDHLGEIVGGTVQETLNALLDEEASRLDTSGLKAVKTKERDITHGNSRRRLEKLMLKCRN